jgi:ParB/Sulfiredoxin domain
MLPVHMLFFLDAAILKEPEMGTQARLPRPPSEPGGEDERHDPMRLPWRPLMLPLNALRQADRKARTHSKQQIRRIADSILHLGFINPIVVDRRRKIVAGIGRFEAAKLLGLRVIPVICVEHLSDAQLRAYSLADNRLAPKSGST